MTAEEAAVIAAAVQYVDRGWGIRELRDTVLAMRAAERRADHAATLNRALGPVGS